MRIECPSCAAAYEVPEEKLAPGRKVRCARCQADWVPLAPETTAREQRETPEPLEPPVTTRDLAGRPAVTAMDRLAREPARRHSRSAAPRAAWVASFLVLAAIGWSAYAWRGEIVRAWPPSERVYVALGLR